MSATVFSKLSGRFAPYRLTLFGLISYSGSPCPAPPESSPLLSKFLQGHVGWSYSRFEISFFSSLSRACTSAVKCYCDWTLANAWWASRAAPWYGNCLQCRRRRLSPCVRRVPWERERHPTPVFLPGKSHGQRTGGLQSLGAQKSQKTT